MSSTRDETKQLNPLLCKEDEVFISIMLTAEAITREQREFLKAYDLTPPQYNVLRILRGAGRGGLICREISDRLVTHDPDVTKLLDRLEARGLVIRERPPQNRRAVVAYISKEGMKLLKRIDEPITARFKELLGHIELNQLDALTELLKAVRDKVS